MKQRFSVGDEVLVRKKSDGEAAWVIGKITNTRMLGPGGEPWRHDRHTIDAATMEYTLVNKACDPRHGRYGFEVKEVEFDICSAAPNPYRDCWHGEVEINTRGELQLLCHDFDLDGEETVPPLVRLAGTRLSLTEPATDADSRIVLALRPDLNVTVNLWRMMRLTVDTKRYD